MLFNKFLIFDAWQNFSSMSSGKVVIDPSSFSGAQDVYQYNDLKGTETFAWCVISLKNNREYRVKQSAEQIYLQLWEAFNK